MQVIPVRHCSALVRGNDEPPAANNTISLS